MGPLIAQAASEGYTGKDKPLKQKHQPFHGYFYKILTSQSAHASNGAKNYIVNGHMTGGFALIAWPARYGDSGIMSFIVNQNGIIYRKNLGPATAKVAPHITQYDPDDTWTTEE